MHRIMMIAVVVGGCGEVKAPVSIDAPPGSQIDAPMSVIDAPPDAKVCAQVIDQQLAACASPPIAQCTDAFILFNGQSAAQVFSPVNTGSVEHIRLRMSNPAANTNPVQVSIIDLQGNALALANTSFSADQHVLARVQTPMTIVANWQDVMFSPPAAVTSNQPYAILVRLVGTTDPGSTVHAGWNMYNDFQGAMTDSYARGRFFDCGTGCSQWITEPTYRDAAFEVYVTPNVCP